MKEGLSYVEKATKVIPEVVYTCETAFKKDKKRIMKFVKSFESL